MRAFFLFLLIRQAFKALSLQKKTIQRLLFALSFMPFVSFAAEELSSWALFIQVFNFSIFALALFFLIRKPVQLLCHQRQKNFFAFEKQSSDLEKKKREENEVWEKKLSELESRAKNIKKKAQEEGDRFSAEKQRDLKELEERLKKRSDFLIYLETEKLKKSQFDYWKKELIERSKNELAQLAQQGSFQKKEKEAFINFLAGYRKEA